MDLVARYREQFGVAPPVLWLDDAQDSIEAIEKALESGEPWLRPEFDDIPEEVAL